MKITWQSKIFLFLFSIPFFSHAETLESRLEKMKSLVAKDGRCEFGVVNVPTGKYKDAIPFWPKTIECIGDVTIGEGTMNERSGCAYFKFDPYAGDIHTNRFPKIAEDKLCSNGGLEEVMGMTKYVLTNYKSDPSGISTSEIGWYFYGSIEFMEPRILYTKSNSSKYEDWFKKKRVLWLAHETAVEIKKKDAEAKHREREVANEKRNIKAKEERKKKEALWD